MQESVSPRALRGDGEGIVQAANWAERDCGGATGKALVLALPEPSAESVCVRLENDRCPCNVYTEHIY